MPNKHNNPPTEIDVTDCFLNEPVFDAALANAKQRDLLRRSCTAIRSANQHSQEAAIARSSAGMSLNQLARSVSLDALDEKGRIQFRLTPSLHTPQGEAVMISLEILTPEQVITGAVLTLLNGEQINIRKQQETYQ